MVIKGISIRNFRCFKDFSLDFGERATVIFGKNGTGKSTLIHSLHKALSFIMYSDKIYTTEIVKGKKKRKLIEVKTITNNNPYLKVEGFSRNGDYNNHTDSLIEIETSAEIPGRGPINWKMSAFATNNRLRPSEFIDAFRTFFDWHTQTDKLPVLAYYSDCFPHKEDQKKDTYKKRVSILRNFGYFDWNAVEGCTKEWINRLEYNFFNIRQSRDLIAKLSNTQNEEERYLNDKVIEAKSKVIKLWEDEVDAIEKILQRFTKDLLISEESSFEIAGLNIHPENHDLCVVTRNGKEISFVHLPSGYKRLFSLILDLAYRCYILNKKDIDNASGIAIIDEIDLHLHPELENVVLNRLMELFPKIQFIVSTHSANVLTSLVASDDLKIAAMPIDYSEPQYFEDIYGIDVNSGQQEVMEVTPNGQQLQRMIDQCAYMLSKDLPEQGNRLKEHILSKQLISENELNNRLRQKINSIL